MTFRLNVLLKFYPTRYRCKLQVIPTFPWFAVSRYDIVYCCFFRDSLKWATADISCLIDIERKFLDRKNIWWCLSQQIAGILHDIQTKYLVMTYGYWYYSKWNDSQNTDFTLFLLINGMNLDIKDSACLYVIHRLQHPTSHLTTRSTNDTMVNVPKKHFSLLPAPKYGKTKSSQLVNLTKAMMRRDARKQKSSEHWEYCAANNLK
jgi:hypothetical protein